MSILKGIVLLLLATALATPALAQVGANGTVAGRVADARGKPIAGALVRAIRVGTDESAEARTDAKGGFRIELATGEYRLEFEAEGFASSSLRDRVTVSPGRDVKLKRKVELPAAEEGSTIRGSVFTDEGRSLAGAKVVLERLADDGTTVSGVVHTTKSDSMGIYAFHVPKGERRYRVTATLDGFESRSITVDVFGGELVNAAALKLEAAGKRDE